MWHKDNPGKDASYRRGYVERSRERYLQSKRERYQREKHLHGEYNRRRLAEDPEHVREIKRQSARRNPETDRAKNRRRAAKLAGASGSHTAEEIARMVHDQGGLCAYCERSLDGVYDLDHMTPLSRGGSDDWTNLAVACPSCNRTKGAKTAEEFAAVLFV